MNMYTREIAEILSITLEAAKKVQDYIEENFDLDFSECTNRQFKSAVLQAAKEMA